MANGQYVVVRCDIKSRARDVFDMVVAHANLVEHFYFGLSFLDGKRTCCVGLNLSLTSSLFFEKFIPYQYSFAWLSGGNI